jgi:hypothetical protein
MAISGSRRRSSTVSRFRRLLDASEAVLISSPEYADGVAER